MYLLCAAATTEKRMRCVSLLVGSSRRFQSFATEKPQQKSAAVAVTTDGQTATDKRKKSLKNSTPLSRLAHSRCDECDGHPDRYPSLPRSLSLSSLGFFRSTHLLPGAEVEVFGVLCSSMMVFRRGFLQGMRQDMEKPVFSCLLDHRLGQFLQQSVCDLHCKTSSGVVCFWRVWYLDRNRSDKLLGASYINPLGDLFCIELDIVSAAVIG